MIERQLDGGTNLLIVVLAMTALFKVWQVRPVLTCCSNPAGVDCICCITVFL